MQTVEWIESIVNLDGSKAKSWVGLVDEKVVYRIELRKKGEYDLIERGADIIPFLGRVDHVLHTATTLEGAKAFCKA
tara:strand:+ start:1724 stop:1954 length:231 start_codon:yes stop_codon:yes gene_type:complete